jgi:probable phosphoglycerate mutase
VITDHDLFVLRHGETEWNVAERLQGWRDSPLTARGVEQAQAQRGILARVCPEGIRLRSSPAPRALRTAQIAMHGLESHIIEDPRLVEIGLGDWTGRTLADLRATMPEIADDPHMWKFNAPGGETLADMVARCRGVLVDIDGPTILVTHGVTSRVLRCLALGIAPERLSDLPGGQGVVHYITGGRGLVLTQ